MHVNPFFAPSPGKTPVLLRLCFHCLHVSVPPTTAIVCIRRHLSRVPPAPASRSPPQLLTVLFFTPSILLATITWAVAHHRFSNLSLEPHYGAALPLVIVGWLIHLATVPLVVIGWVRERRHRGVIEPEFKTTTTTTTTKRKRWF